MANSRKMTNTEIMEEISQMTEAEAAAAGVSSELQDAAREAVARGDVNGYFASRIGTYSPLYNAVTGFVSKLVHQSITKATYHDKWKRHRRGEIPGGDVELAFVKLGTAGTGNASGLNATAFPTSGMTVTSSVTAKAPDVLHAYKKVPTSYEARVPLGRKNLKDAFTTEYGLNDIIDKMRESALKDLILYNLNDDIEIMISEPLNTASALYADSTNPAAATASGRARFHALEYTDESPLYASKIDFNTWTDDELMDVYISLKQIAYRMTGDPSTRYNVYGAINNVESLSKLVCYINSDLWAVLTTRINSAAFNVEELKAAGLEIVPIMAGFVDSAPTAAAAINATYKGDISSGRARCVGLICDEQYVEEWTVADDTTVTPAERDEILTRFYDSLQTRRDYACNCYLFCECPANLG